VLSQAGRKRHHPQGGLAFSHRHPQLRAGRWVEARRPCGEGEQAALASDVGRGGHRRSGVVDDLNDIGAVPRGGQHTRGQPSCLDGGDDGAGALAGVVVQTADQGDVQPEHQQHGGCRQTSRDD